jgi:hypothetical protein
LSRAMLHSLQNPRRPITPVDNPGLITGSAEFRPNLGNHA